MNSKYLLSCKILPSSARILCFVVVVFLFLSFFDQSSFAQIANTPTANPAQPSFSEVISRMLPMFALVFMIYYFMIIKPQQLKVKSQADLTASLKKGDSVVTTGGIFGRVSSVETDGVSIEVAPNVKIKVELAHIARKNELEVGSSAASKVK